MVSDDPADWGDFGDYLSGTYTILTLIATVAVVFIARGLAKRDQSIQERKKALETIFKQIITLEDSFGKPSQKGGSKQKQRTALEKYVRLIGKNKLYIPKDLDGDLADINTVFSETLDENKGLNRTRIEQVKDNIRKHYGN